MVGISIGLVPRVETGTGGKGAQIGGIYIYVRRRSRAHIDSSFTSQIKKLLAARAEKKVRSCLPAWFGILLEPSRLEDPDRSMDGETRRVRN